MLGCDGHFGVLSQLPSPSANAEPPTAFLGTCSLVTGGRRGWQKHNKGAQAPRDVRVPLCPLPHSQKGLGA